MKIEINHKEIEIADDCKTLSQLLSDEQLSGPGLAVAVDNRVVSRKDWDSFILSDGIKIIVIHAVCGG